MVKGWKYLSMVKEGEEVKGRQRDPSLPSSTEPVTYLKEHYDG